MIIWAKPTVWAMQGFAGLIPHTRHNALRLYIGITLCVTFTIPFAWHAESIDLSIS